VHQVHPLRRLVPKARSHPPTHTHTHTHTHTQTDTHTQTYTPTDTYKHTTTTANSGNNSNSNNSNDQFVIVTLLCIGTPCACGWRPRTHAHTLPRTLCLIDRDGGHCGVSVLVSLSLCVSQSASLSLSVHVCGGRVGRRKRTGARGAQSESGHPARRGLCAVPTCRMQCLQGRTSSLGPSWSADTAEPPPPLHA
jgi:hypothetical protein